MPSLILDPDLESRLKADRALTGADRYDEVWEGTYMMSPLADLEHQRLAFKLAQVFDLLPGSDPRNFVVPARNVSDGEFGWEHNYRCPDVAVYLPTSPSRYCGTHWQGGPDFAVEIMSPYDRSRDKLPFYAAINTGELLLVDHHPLSLELYRLDPHNNLPLIARSTPADQTPIASALFPLPFQLTPDPATPSRPTLRVTRTDAAEQWDL